MQKLPSLEQIFAPRGVAVVGVSEKNADSYARQAVRCLKEAGFPAIFPINPNYKDFEGLPCYSSLKAVPQAIDHVICCLPTGQALGVLNDCATKQVRSIHFFTAGFSESGDAARAALESEMLRKARQSGFRIIGPNCMGLYVPSSRLIAWPEMSLEAGSIGLMSQSGGHGQDIPVYGAPRGLRFSKVVSFGNGLDINESELLDYFRQDADTEIIALYLEGVKDGRRFKRALAAAAACKPVVIYKGGNTAAGNRATLSHTASLVNSAKVFAALCRQLNVILVSDMDELIDVLVALRFLTPLPDGGGVALVGRGGAPSVLASDEMERAGLGLPPLSSEIQAELRQWLPLDGTILVNPVDSAPLLQGSTIAAVMRILAALPDVHLLVYHLGFHSASRWGHGRFGTSDQLESTIAAMAGVRRQSGKPVAILLRPAADKFGTPEFLMAREAFARAGFPVFHDIRRAATAIARVLSWRQQRAGAV